MLYSTVALSVIISFLTTELTGLLTGGMISAGYLAYWFGEPMRIVSTLLMSILIAMIIRVSRHFLILYDDASCFPSSYPSLECTWWRSHISLFQSFPSI